MKLSKDTIDILKNFSNINPHLHIKKGSSLVVMNPDENLFAKAAIVEEFPNAVRIYDMNQLLGVISLIPNAELEFGDKSVVISEGSKSIEYLYADQFMVPETPEVRLTPDKVVLTCTLSNAVLDTA